MRSGGASGTFSRGSLGVSRLRSRRRSGNDANGAWSPTVRIERRRPARLRRQSSHATL